MSKKNKKSKKSKPQESEQLFLRYPDPPPLEWMVAEAGACECGCSTTPGHENYAVGAGLLAFMEMVGRAAGERFAAYAQLVGLPEGLIDQDMPLPTEVVADMVLMTKTAGVAGVLAACIDGDLMEMVPALHLYLSHVMVYLRAAVSESDGIEDLEVMLASVTRDFA